MLFRSLCFLAPNDTVLINLALNKYLHVYCYKLYILPLCIRETDLSKGRHKAEHLIVTDDDVAKWKAYIPMLSFVFVVPVLSLSSYITTVLHFCLMTDAAFTHSLV